MVLWSDILNITLAYSIDVILSHLASAVLVWENAVVLVVMLGEFVSSDEVVV